MEMIINGVTLRAEFMDAGFMDVFEPALNKLQQELGRSRERSHPSVAAGFRELNAIIDNFFDTVWGEDTSDCIFAGSGNSMVRLEAVAQVDAASKEERKRFNDFSNRYTQRQQNGFQSMQGHQKKQKPGPGGRHT